MFTRKSDKNSYYSDKQNVKLRRHSKSFYTSECLAAKAFPDESVHTIDRMITDQFIVGCEETELVCM